MYKTPKDKITSVFKAAGAKVKDVASDVMTIPAKAKLNKTMRKDKFEFDTLKTVNQNQGKPDSGDYTDPLFRARVSAKNIAFDKKQK